MKITIWHCGVLMGDAHVRRGTANLRQVSGHFRPTEYGRSLLPQLTGLLSAAAALKHDMSERGMSEDALPAAAVLEEFLDTSPAGQRVLDVGRIIVDLELRDRAGETLPFKTIGFLDVAELQAIAHSRRNDSAMLSTGSSLGRVVLVSATLADRPAGLPARHIEIA